MSEPAAAQSRGKRRQASEARRRAILDAAFDMFIADGFSAARLDDIAKRAVLPGLNLGHLRHEPADRVPVAAMHAAAVAALAHP